MKHILLLSFILPVGLIAQDRWADGLYNTPDPRTVNNSTATGKNQTPAVTVAYRSGFKIVTTNNSMGFPRQEALNVYPNPAVADAKAIFTSRENGVKYTLQMVSLEGRPLLQRVGTTLIGTNIVPLNMDSYPTGTYFLQLFVGDRKETTRFIKVVR